MPPVRKLLSPDKRAARTREALLDAALLCLRERGYEATAVDDVLSATKLTKGAFYFHFQSKEDFALAAIDRALARFWPEIEAAMRTRGDDPFTPIHLLFKLFSANCAFGCIFGNLSAEMAARSPAIRQRLAGVFDCWLGALVFVMDDLKRQRAITLGTDSAVLARLALAQLQGALLLNKLEPERNHLDTHARAFTALLAAPATSSATGTAS
jgi:TetR/AcrR family transcriptional repressor of nem operon